MQAGQSNPKDRPEHLSFEMRRGMKYNRLGLEPSGQVSTDAMITHQFQISDPMAFRNASMMNRAVSLSSRLVIRQLEPSRYSFAFLITGFDWPWSMVASKRLTPR